MSDNVTITPGSGATVKADDVGSGVLAQDVKVGWGPNDSWTYADAPTGLPIAFQRPTSQALTWAAVSFNSSGDNTVVAGTGGQTVRVFVLVFTVAAALVATFKDSTPTSLSGAMSFNLGGGLALGHQGEPWFITASGKGFVMNLASAIQVSGFIGYTKS